MKTRLLLLCCLWSLFVPAKAQKTTQVLLVSLDGISTEGLLAAQTPNIDQLMHEGAYTYKARNIIPSNTLPNWTSMLCGSGPERHGVTANSWTVNNVTLSSISKDDDGYYPSIFKILKEQRPEALTAYYWNWKALINSLNPKYMDEKNFLENDAYIPNFERAFEFMRTNRDKSWLTFLYDVHTDHAGHGHKWMSSEYLKSIEEADVEIGKLLTKLKNEGMYDDMYIFFLTDHGGINYGHGGYTDNEMLIPFSVKGKGIKQGEIKDHYFTVNTASTIAYLFGLKQPQEWSGMVVESMFGLSNPTILPSDKVEDAVYYTIKNISEGGYLTVKDGKLTVSEEVCDAANWYLTKAENGGYYLYNKTLTSKPLGESGNEPALANEGKVWFLCPSPEKAGAYCISQSADASSKSLSVNTEEAIGYWTPSVFGHDGVLWTLASDDPRSQIDELRAELTSATKKADKAYDTIKDRVSDKIPGSYSADAGNALKTALESAHALLDKADATIEEISACINTLETTIEEALSAPTLDFEHGATYRIKNADPRFKGLTYMYSNSANQVRWGVINSSVPASNYDWIINVEKSESGNIITLINKGTMRYLGSSAWDAARPSSINTSAEVVKYRFDNTKSENLQEWCLRSIDSETVANPTKSYLACTDDNDNNLTDGRVLPWNPTDGTAQHDGYWIFEKVTDSGLSEEVIAKQQGLQNAINTASELAAIMEKTLPTKSVGSYSSQSALDALKNAIKTAEGAMSSKEVSEIEAATTAIEKAYNTAKVSPQVTFKDGATYRIVNADPRFDNDNIYMYINASNIARWGIMSRIVPEGSELWTIKIDGEYFLLQNNRTGMYLGSTAWDNSRPANITVSETATPYQIRNSFSNDPSEWCMRSTDAFHVIHEESSYLACSGDNATNLAEGIIRPWDPTDAVVGLHDSYWRFVEVEEELSDEVIAKQQELQNAISAANEFAQLMEKTLQTKTVGSYTSLDALNTLKNAIATAENTTSGKDLTVLTEAIVKLGEAVNTAKVSPQVTFKDGATYRIVNADPRFDKAPIRLYINANNVARWGIESKIVPANSDYWTLSVSDGYFTMLNARTEKYLGSCAWDASRPSSVPVTETPIPYEIVNTFGTDPREWCMRSTDSFEAAKAASSYIACSGDSNTNLAEGSIRPWDPTDAKVGLHDAYWTFEEVTLPTDIETTETTDEQVQVVDGRIIVTPASTSYTIYATDGKKMNNETTLPDGAYIVSTRKSTYKVLVNR